MPYPYIATDMNKPYLDTIKAPHKPYHARNQEDIELASSASLASPLYLPSLEFAAPAAATQDKVTMYHHQHYLYYEIK